MIMPIRIVCASCSATLSAPDTAAGKMIRCPKCGASVSLPKLKASPPPTALDDEDERPRKKAKKKEKKGAGSLVWVLAAVGAVLVIVLGVGGFFVVRAVLASRDNVPAVAGGGSSSSTGSSVSARPKYVPRVSEKKLEEFLKDRSPEEISQITDDQVYAIMGEPTRRDAPITARKNGQVFTVYKAFWEEPGSGVQSSIGFVNGRMSGAVVGLEITPPKSSDGK
jgi:hypothetical protein